MTNAKTVTKNVLIVGGGFGGVAAAQALLRHHRDDIAVTLVSDVPHFEYKPALYLVVAGRPASEVCIPLTEMFGTQERITLVTDTITAIDGKRREAAGASGKRYTFDTLILATGSETAFFDIPGIEKFAFGFKTIEEAVVLQRHIESQFASPDARADDADEKLESLHFVIVGAGPSGVELAGELAVYGAKLAKRYAVDPTFVTFDLFEAAPRILPSLPVSVAERALHRLRHLGVNVYTNRPITSQALEEVRVRGMRVATETVIWTAGIRPDALYRDTAGFEHDKRERVVVDAHLQAGTFPGIFIVGDGGATPFTGLAQTAIGDGAHVVENVLRIIDEQPLLPYRPKKPYHVIPVGPGWAVTKLGSLTISGKFAWLIRRAADFRYFLSILPFAKAFLVFRKGKTICSACSICMPPADALDSAHVTTSEPKAKSIGKHT